MTLCMLAGMAVAAPLETFRGCTFVEAPWADGDSFPVKLPGGRQITARLYGADCIEMHVATDSDARRLRDQRRYFGIAGPDAATSVARARKIGADAAKRVRALLAEPFTVRTAFADAAGDGHFQRYYVFIETAGGEDLAEVLVREGLARAFGVYREGPGGVSRDEYRGRLDDAELLAAKAGKGAWAHTDWTTLADERRRAREESAEMSLSKRTPKTEGKVDPNTASRDELMTLPGVGEKLAQRIIESREAGPFSAPDDLARIPGIGPAGVERLRAHLMFGSGSPK